MAKSEIITSEVESSTFDPEMFMSQDTEEEMETKYTPIPEDDYVSMIDETLSLKEVNGTPVIDLYHIIDAPDLAATLGLDRISVKQSIFLDVGPDGTLAVGTNKNVNLGRLRAALGQNKSGQRWNPNMLAGAGPLRIKVTKSPDKNDPTIIYNRVVATTRM